MPMSFLVTMSMRPTSFRALQQIPRHAVGRGIAMATVQSHGGASEPPVTTSSIDDPLANSRFERLRNAPPFSSFLTDSFERQHTYLRISITERCNLRCTYCMPEAGVPLSPENDNLTTPEILLLSELFVSQGVNKIRLTGGEPTIRKDILSLMQRLGGLRSKGLKELALTTNGVALWRKLDAMAEAGLTGVNLSLDTLDPHLFQIITRRKGFEAVIKSMDRIHELNRLGANIKLKINCVVTRGINDREILDFVELGREKDVEIRFIEYMPFDGNKWVKQKMFSYEEMLQVIRSRYPGIQRLKDKRGETSKTWQIPGFVGRVGFITSMTENFCGTCNRLRITSDGNLKVCLFGNAEVSLRDLLRQTNSGDPLDEAAYESVREIEESARVASRTAPAVFRDALHERQLLDIIGQAIGRKKARHAGMENLSTMPNRPMILIDSLQDSFRSTWTPKPRLQAPFTRAQRATPVLCLTDTRPKPTAWVPELEVPQAFSYSSKSGQDLDAIDSDARRSLPENAQQATEDDTKARESAPLVREFMVHDRLSPRLPHLTDASKVHMVSVGEKKDTTRQSIAIATVTFSNSKVLPAIQAHAVKKGDVLSVARIAAIMGAKRTPDIVPLCHPGLQITNVVVDVEAVDSEHDSQRHKSAEVPSDISKDSLDGMMWYAKNKWLAKGVGPHGAVKIAVKVACFGKTGVEMEALTAATAGALTVIDMCKALDKGMQIMEAKMVAKEGGRSGRYVDRKWLNL